MSNCSRLIEKVSIQGQHGRAQKQSVFATKQYVCFLTHCDFVPHVQGGQGVWSWSYGHCELPDLPGFWEPNFDPLEDQQMFLTPRAITRAQPSAPMFQKLRLGRIPL